MPDVTAPVIQLTAVVKQYGGLRPLRIAELEVRSGERVALSGLDATAAPVLVNLVTGAMLPDEGMVRSFGRSSAEIRSGDDWLASLERFGIVSPRAVLLEDATVQQNLAMPYTLQIDPVPRDIAERVAALSAECGLDAALLTERVGKLPADLRARLHFARAIALAPQLLILEHPTADVSPGGRAPFARTLAAAAQARGLTVLAITFDADFAAIVAHRSLTLNGATGAVKKWKKGWF
jgi:ABC-type transporter Mla maintaining outer membrane lipid asymmetry ATPase subunit MlaF